MLTRQQFVTHLTAANRRIYLRGPSCFHTQSSMLPVVNAVDAYGALANGANLLALIRAIGNVPAAKKIKYDGPLRALYNSFPNFIYVSVNPAFALSTAQTPGINVCKQPNVPSHQVDAVLALSQLDALPSGHALLAALQAQAAARPARWTEVKCAAATVSGGNECAIFGGRPDNYQTTLAAALIGNPNNVGALIGPALTALGHPPAAGNPAPFTWLQGQIDNSPVYKLVGPPSATPSSAVHGVGWISAATLQNWANGTTVFPAGVAAGAVDDAKVVLGTVLRDGAVAGPGGHARVKWNASNLTAGGVARPPYIGLGHELVHALHNTRGEQPGSENGHTTTALYEYLCVGLGVFATAPITENTLRGDAGLALRTRYA
ncbi:hypothetical protein FKG94_08120 [Exilibacterium tricleocarpae]|uniref:Uncharacterized protein n=1 Tax=Exilibacterium tricleocarpae TaxID=2591008 RepID=A0A545TZR6_9GAMM|nr:M91 family zinc metallopeptidase [Exilibacterium tricleocarpae]TQV82683.1 hypothetical protein FKG94_08120 [Exilibacterium tricleocarpae]